MVSKQVGAILTILGGVFYIIGSLFGALVGSFLYAMGTAFQSTNSSGAGTFALFLLGFGVVMGIVIILGGVWLNSDRKDTRRGGGILAICGIIFGALPTLGGLVIGFFFVVVGSVIGLTYKPGAPDVVIGVTDSRPVAPAMVSASSAPVRTSGRVRFCIKCGEPLHEGAVFCGSCGAKVPD